MIELITHLNKAAYLILKGNAKLIGFEGKYANNCKLRIEIEKEVLDQIYKNNDHIVDYKKYMLLRSKLKMKIRKSYDPYFGKGVRK